MKRFLKTLAFLVSVLFLLALALAVLIPLFLDPNQHKPRIEALVLEHTGRPLTIDGDIGLTVFPWLGAEIAGLSLGPAPGFGDKPFLAARGVRVRVKLLPLVMQRAFEMDTFQAARVELDLQRRNDGVANWDDLIALGSSDGTDSDPAQSLGALTLGGVAIEQLSVDWRDGVTGQRASISNAFVNISALSFEEPVAFELTGEVIAETPSRQPSGTTGAAPATRIAGPISIAGAADLADIGIRIAVDGLRLTADLDSEGLPLSSLALALDTNVEYTLADQSIQLGDVAVSKLEATTTDAMRLSASGSAGSATFEPGASRLDIAKLTLDAAATGGPFGAESSKIQLTTSISANLAAQRFTLSSTSVTATALPNGAESLEIVSGADLILDLDKSIADAPSLSIAGVLSAAEPKGRISYRVSTAMQADLDSQTIALGKTTADLQDIDLQTGKGSASFVADSAVLTASNGSFRIDALSGNAKLKDIARSGASAAFTLTKTNVLGTKDNVVLKPLDLAVTKLDWGTLSGALGVSGEIRHSLSRGQLDVKALTVNGDLRDEATPLQSIRFTAKASGRTNLQNGELSLAPLSVRVPSFTFDDYSGDLVLAANLSGNTRKQVFAAKGLELRGLVSGSSLPNKQLRIAAATDLRADLGAERLSLTGFSNQVLGITTTGSIEIDSFLSNPRAVGNIAVAPFDMRKLLAVLKVPYRPAGPKALRRVALRTALDVSARKMRFDKLELNLDQSRLTGILTLDDLQNSALYPMTTFDLVVNGINLDSYLPPESASSKRAAKAGAKKAEPGAATPGTAPAMLPAHVLEKLRLDGKVRVGKLTVNKMRISNVRLSAVAKDGQLTLEPMRANLYRGTFEGTTKMTAREGNVSIQTRETLADVQAGPLFRDLQGKASLTGTANIALDLSGSGRTRDALVRSLSGKSSFDFRDGTIEGVDMVQTICEYLAGAGVVSQTSANGSGASTKFSRMSGSANINQGIAENRDLRVESPFISVTGSGTANLLSQRPDYVLEAHLIDNCQGQGRQMSERLLDIPIPVRVGGTFNKLAFRFDFERLIEAIAQRELSRKLGRLLGGDKDNQPSSSPGTQPAEGSNRQQDPIKDIIEEGAGKILRGLFK